MAPSTAPAGSDASTQGDVVTNSDAQATKPTGTDASTQADAVTSSDAQATKPTGTDASTQGDAVTSSDAQATKPWDWTGIVGTGQSLSVGELGTPVKATKQPFSNLKLALNGAAVPPFDPTDTALSLVPLVEPIRAFATTYPSAYPANIYGETPHTTMGSEISTLFRGATGTDYVTVHTVVGENGQALSVIDKTAVELADGGGMSTGFAYAATLFEAKAITRMASAARKTYGIGAIFLTHGETDSGNSAYEQGLVQLWTDYNTDLSAITAQTTSIPMFVSQQNAEPLNAGTTTAAPGSAPPGSTSLSTLAQWKVGVDHEGSIVCSGPKYQYPYATDSTGQLPGLHLTAQGYDLLGEKFGEIYYEKVVMGLDWQPLEPIMSARSGSTVTVQFHVPVGPLTWDETFPSPHPTTYPQWTSGRGFEVLVDGMPEAITSVDIVGAAKDMVQITCGTDLTGRSVSVAYAYTADGTMMPGGTWRWGQLRDADAFVGATTQSPQPNYSVAFSMQVP